jgi:anti-anti-sigma regulatory factor
MLRISELVADERGLTLLIEGHVAGAWANELRRVCEEQLPADGRRRLTLDLTGVAFLDHDGVALFRDLARVDVSFVNATPFIAEQLRGVADVRQRRG